MAFSRLNRISISLILLLWLLISGLTQAEAGKVLPPLERPADQVIAPERGILLTITTAGKRLVAAGQSGVIIFSDDNGATWRQAKVPVSVALTAIHFPSPEKGWAVGHFGVVLHSRDRGETWEMQLDGAKAAALALEDAERRLANNEGDSAVLQRKLGEAKLLVDDGPDKPFLDVLFMNERSGFAVGAYNLIFRTDDGGANWKPWLHNVENPEALHFYGMSKSGTNLFIAGERGLFLRSSDAGMSFHAISTPYEGSYFGLLTPPDAVVLYGLRGNLFRSPDEGKTWQKVPVGVSSSLSAGIQLTDGGMILTTSQGDVLLSRDRGKTFSSVPVPMPAPFADLIEAQDGSLILAGPMGLARIALSEIMPNDSSMNGARR